MNLFRLLCLSLAVCLLGCEGASEQSPDGLPVVPMQIGNKTYQLEIAADDHSREKGLMERDTLGADRGMIFVFPEAKPQNFWMHHTRFDLDIIYAGSDEKVVSIHTMKAYDESNVPSGAPAKYAVELNAGETKSDGVKVGETLKFPPQVDQSVK